MDESTRKLFNLLEACGMIRFYMPMLDYGFDNFDDFQVAIEDPRACVKLLDQVGIFDQQWSVLVNAYLKLKK